MNSLPIVTEQTREFVSRQFDGLGPEACLAELVEILRHENPEVLDMARRWASDLQRPELMVGFAMFYRLLATAAAETRGALPVVSAATRERLIAEIDDLGDDTFTRSALDELARSNPELLQMADGFASRRGDYLQVMSGFGLLYRAFILQLEASRPTLH